MRVARATRILILYNLYVLNTLLLHRIQRMGLILYLREIYCVKVYAAYRTVVCSLIVNLAIRQVDGRGPLRSTWKALLCGIFDGYRHIKII